MPLADWDGSPLRYLHYLVLSSLYSKLLAPLTYIVWPSVL